MFSLKVRQNCEKIEFLKKHNNHKELKNSIISSFNMIGLEPNYSKKVDDLL